MKLTPESIKWIKNIKDSEQYGAYLDVSSEFHLHFPHNHWKNAGTLECGDVILLFQQIGTAEEKSDIMFTHLVTPVDKWLCQFPAENPVEFTRRVKVIAKCVHTPFITKTATLFNDISLSGVNNGNFCKIENIKEVQQKDMLTELQNSIYSAFLPYLLEN